jgi:uncharacterized protein YndB with AHSA1/START domain
MAENIKVSDIMPAPPERLYAAWLDPHEHTKMTGGDATDEGDGRFTAWDGYITGRTVSAVPHSKIVQAWRTSEFPDSAPDSVLTILFEAADGGTKVTFVHENIPEGQGDAYEQGWHEHYLTPMKAYFGSPMEQVREVGERITHAVEEVTEQFEAATEDAMHAVDKARANARRQAVKAVKAVKKVQKKATAQLKAVGKKVTAAFKAKKKPTAKAKAKPAPKKKAKPAAKAKTKLAAKKKAKPAAKKKKR